MNGGGKAESLTKNDKFRSTEIVRKKNYLGAESIYFGWNIGCTGKVEREN